MKAKHFRYLRLFFATKYAIGVPIRDTISGHNCTPLHNISWLDTGHGMCNTYCAECPKSRLILLVRYFQETMKMIYIDVRGAWLVIIDGM